jgi:hypothetical protein
MVERYVKTIEEHLRKVVSTHQRDWDKRLSIFLLAYRASTHDTTGMTPADLVDRLHDTHHYARRQLRVASDHMKLRYDRPANSAGFQEGDGVWLYRPTRTRGRSPKLQSAWEDPYKVITRMKDVVYRIQRHPRSRIMVVHLDRLAPYLGATRDEQP